MATTGAAAAATAAYSDMAAFHRRLLSSRRIVALCGAGLSAASGLPTFRGAGGFWRNHDATKLATPGAFKRDPGLVWLFYAYRRHMALRAQPNPGHYALAALVRAKNDDFLCLTQNVDGLSPRAGHPPEQLRLMHGSLLDLKCFDQRNCGYVDRDNLADPLCPALAAAAAESGSDGAMALLDAAVPLAPIPASELPACPRCNRSLLRPGVVWFGEDLDQNMLSEADDWIEAAPVDLILVIGTTAIVSPAASYIEMAREAGAAVVTVNLDAHNDENLADLEEGDFAFAGDAAVLLPQMLEPLIGKIEQTGQ